MHYKNRMKGIGALALAIVVIAAIVIGGGVLLYGANQMGLFRAQVISTGGSGSGGQSSTGNTIVLETDNGCPDDKDTVVTFTQRNVRDTTASTTFDTTGYIYKMVNGEIAGEPTTITDTTAGTVTLDCNQDYVLKLARGNAYLGNNSRILGLTSSVPGAEVVNGALKFKTAGSNMPIGLQGSQHGLLEFRLFDANNNAFNYDTNNADNTAWEVTNSTFFFNSTTAATAATALAAGEDRTWRLYFRSNNSVGEFNDQGTLILIEAPTATYKKPVCSLDNGAAGDRDGDGNLIDRRDSLTAEERVQFSSYEYAYVIGTETKVSNNQHILTCTFDALDGVNPVAADNIEIDFAARGNYLSVDGSTVKTGAADDTSSYAVVFTVQHTAIDIS